MAAMLSEDDSVVGYTYEDIERMAADILSHSPLRPRLGIICGTGLDGLEGMVNDPTTVKYEAITGFPVCTVKGHHGRFVIGTISGKAVLLMIGRFHYYEGYPMWKVAMPVRVMKAMGIETLLVTNAAGGMDPSYQVGDVMILNDHIDLPGMLGQNVLRGRNDERFGPRFLATNSIYDPVLRGQFKEVGEELGLSGMIKEGMYFYTSGPTFNTLGELRMLRLFGVDAIGMSTVPETVVAKHSGMRVFAFSFIADVEVFEEKDKIELTHDQVLEMAREKSPVLQNLMTHFIGNIVL